MEDHKSEIDNWDLGAGIYISFYSLKSSLVDNESSMNELVSKISLLDLNSCMIGTNLLRKTETWFYFELVHSSILIQNSEF